MALLKLPIQNDIGDFNFKIDLDEVSFFFFFQYNARDDSWFISVSDADEIPLVQGIKIVVDVNLFGQFAHLAIPQGNLFCSNSENLNTEPNLENFGNNVQLFYDEVL